MTNMPLSMGTLLLCAVLPVMAGKSPQNPVVQNESPKQEVHELLDLETNGAVLESGGWQKVSALFLRHNPLAGNPEILVVSSKYVVNETPVSHNRAKVNVELIELGVIEPGIRWKAAGPSVKLDSTYHLFFGDIYWNSLSESRAMRRLTGPAMWRIDAQGPIRVCWFSKASAIRYVTEMREKSKDPSVKANADKTLAILEKLQD